MQSLSRGGAVTSFGTPISQSKRADYEGAALALTPYWVSWAQAQCTVLLVCLYNLHETKAPQRPQAPPSAEAVSLSYGG
jgi:hypothetical protein